MNKRRMNVNEQATTGPRTKLERECQAGNFLRPRDGVILHPSLRPQKKDATKQMSWGQYYPSE